MNGLTIGVGTAAEALLGDVGEGLLGELILQWVVELRAARSGGGGGGGRFYVSVRLDAMDALGFSD